MDFLNFIKNNKKFPSKIYKFIKNRFDKNIFIGLPFTILFFVFIYIFNEFIGLTDSIINHGIITHIDIRLSDFFYYFRDGRLINFFLFISYFGNKIVILFVSFLFTLFLFLRGKIFEIIGMLSGFIIVYLGVFISKIIFIRPRPSFAIYFEDGYSFPSIYASFSFILYGFIIYLFLKRTKKHRKKVKLYLIGILIIFFVGLSRLYLNVNYLSDIIGGWFLGFLGLSFGITIKGFLKYNFKKVKFKIYKKIYKNYFIIIVGIIIFFLGFFYKNYYSHIKFLNPQKSIFSQIRNLNDFLNKNKNLFYTETITGRSTEPINFIFITKDKSKIERLFKKSGWSEADRIGRTSIKKMERNLFGHKKYSNAPITPLYWNKKIQNFGFQKLPNENTIKFRHHIRIWKTDYKLGKYFIFVGCGVYDNGLKWGITHKIDPNLDKEREFIFRSLKKSNLIKNYRKIELLGKYSGNNFSGDKFFTDGRVYILKLK